MPSHLPWYGGSLGVLFRPHWVLAKLHTLLRIVGDAFAETQNVALPSRNCRRPATQGLRFEDEAWAPNTSGARLFSLDSRCLESAVDLGAPWSGESSIDRPQHVQEIWFWSNCLPYSLQQGPSRKTLAI